MNEILRRRRALMKKTKSGLPSAYQEVEYIVSDIYCIIPTTFYFQLNDTVNFTASTNTATGSTRYFFATGSSSVNCCSLFVYGTNVYMNWCSRTTSNRFGTMIWNSSKVYNVKFENGFITATNTADPTEVYTAAYPTYTGIPATPLALIGNPAASHLGLDGRMYTYTVTRNGSTVFNAVPCYRKADNVIGMFDTVSQTFLTNTGTGNLSKGADVA